jgi:enoyl-CoA hydratase/carnithine racemase
MRFASRERAVFSQPEIGFGFFPGGGGLERLPLVTGRSRAMEIILGGEDLNADTAERYGWINRALSDAELDTFVDRFAIRVASFDRPAIVAVKEILNPRGPLAHGADLQATEAKFHQVVAGPAVQGHVRKLMAGGGQQRAASLR